MGTFTHDQDLEAVVPALRQVCARRPGQIEIQIIGGLVESAAQELLADLPFRLIRAEPGEEEYPLFMLWFTARVQWDLAIAPLQNNAFNRCKSDLKFLDYSAIACPAIFSDAPAYRGAVEHMRNGLLVQNQTEQWMSAIETLLEDANLHQRISRRVYQELHAARTLASASRHWQEALEFALQPPAPPPNPPVSIVIPTKNAEAYLTAQLEAIFNQATAFDFDVTLIDSGSKDRTPEIAAAYPVSLINIPPQEFNHGSTRNLGARQARPESEFIVFLSQDACPENPGMAGAPDPADARRPGNCRGFQPPRAAPGRQRFLRAPAHPPDPIRRRRTAVQEAARRPGGVPGAKVLSELFLQHQFSNPPQRLGATAF
ncbi:MAG: glycosyltransferase [Anaerolineales bacterium]|nr:glycosyltransferase [Anaerolineales bacterium]